MALFDLHSRERRCKPRDARKQGANGYCLNSREFLLPRRLSGGSCRLGCRAVVHVGGQSSLRKLTPAAQEIPPSFNVRHEGWLPHLNRNHLPPQSAGSESDARKDKRSESRAGTRIDSLLAVQPGWQHPAEVCISESVGCIAGARVREPGRHPPRKTRTFRREGTFQARLFPVIWGDVSRGDQSPRCRRSIPVPGHPSAALLHD